MDSRHYYSSKLIDAREKNKRTQQEVADLLNVDRQTIYRAEAGKNASFELLAGMCRVYGLPMTDVIIPHPEITAA